MKWFYQAQKEASDTLYQHYKNCPCVWQIVTKDRIVELYQCSNPYDKEWILMQVVITRAAKAVHVSIHQLEYRFGWKVKDKSTIV